MSVPYIQARDPLGLMLAEAGSNFGTGLGQGIKNKQQQSVIDNVLKNSSKIDETGRTVVDPERMFAGLTRSGAFTPQEVQERVKPFSDQRESELTRRSKFKDVPDTQEFKGLLQSLGYDEEKADELSSLYNSLSVGGKTFFGKSVVEQIQRSGGFDTSRSNQRGGQGSLEGGSQQLHPPALQGENIDQVDATEEDTFQWPEINNFKDLTPASPRSKNASVTSGLSLCTFLEKRAHKELLAPKSMAKSLSMLNKPSNREFFNLPKCGLFLRGALLIFCHKLIISFPDIWVAKKSVKSLSINFLVSKGMSVKTSDILFIILLESSSFIVFSAAGELFKASHCLLRAAFVLLILFVNLLPLLANFSTRSSIPPGVLIARSASLSETPLLLKNSRACASSAFLGVIEGFLYPPLKMFGVTKAGISNKS